MISRRARTRTRALEEAVRQLYACIAHGIDGCGPGDLDDEGAPYEVGAYITDRAARCAARQAVYGTS